LLLLAASACAPAPPPTLPNILLIVVDTLRGDRLGVNGNPRGLTPFLDQLGARGTVFTNAYAPTSWTCPSVASLFTSRYASQHHVDRFEASIADSEVTLAEILAGRGYVGGGFSANLRMLEANGYGQGFASWHAYARDEGGGVKPRGALLRRQSLTWLQPVLQNGKQPVLLYLQYMEPHSPYEPGEPYRSRFVHETAPVSDDVARAKLTESKPLLPAEIERLAQLYDGEVAAVDAEIRTLFDALEPSGFLRHAVVVISADHGEEFGEHGVMTHGTTLFNGVMHIPLIVVAPGYPAGRVVDDAVSLVDVAPTLLELTGTEPAPTFEGRSLVPLLRSALAPPALWARMVDIVQGHDVIAEIEPHGEAGDMRKHSQAIVRGSRKLLVDPRGDTALFDLYSDPGETTPLGGASADLASRMLSALAQRHGELKTRAAASGNIRPIDAATKEQLRGLGYRP
jgi:arylsulfatase A-like enzyme